jgi:excisionase family DNA binding protein
MDAHYRDLLDKKQAAQRLHCSLRTINNRIKARSIPFVKLGKSVRFIPADLERFIYEHRTAKNGFQARAGSAL